MIDLLVIGGGPGGYVAAIRASQFGLEVILVEKDNLGGTCLNRGCIPTKAYFQNAKALRTMQNSQEFSISLDNLRFDMAAAKRRKDKIVANLATGVKRLLHSNKIKVISGEARLVDAKTVLVNGEEVQAKNIIIASGSKPTLLPIKGIESDKVLTSDEINDITTVPEKLVIIGAGVIGLEYANIFNTFGSRVTLIESMPLVLNYLDTELSKRMAIFLKRQGIDLHTSTLVEEIIAAGENLIVKAAGKKGDMEVSADIVLVASGRSAQTDNLGLDRLGIKTENGFIQVNENYETNLKNIYAIGDVIGDPMLAHVASEEGIAVAERIAGHSGPNINYNAVPSCIFTFPEIAVVGMGEEEAKAKGINYQVGKYPFSANGKAMTMGETDGMVKVLADENGFIIGVHIIGPHASDLILEGIVLVKNRLNTKEIKGTIHPHPTLGEAIAEAILDIDNQAIHLNPKTK
ncbi:MAG TPA: dihydrolipoyl dehydrogenase [Syntrophomonadaceae bacterium]|nr:dihydrolipoyl dehydrogenase [Syntrophomonadaceae bacterium]